MEQEVCVTNENITVGGLVDSVNGQTGDVVLTTSDLENDSDYQTGTEVEEAVAAEATIRANADDALETAINAKQDKLTAGDNITISNNVISATGGASYTAGDNITISNNVISATDTTYTAGNGLDLTGTEFSADTSVLATQTELAAKANSADLATVATSGSYNDLTNKPTIPTVNDATLTVTQNGTSVGTFTANDADDTTIALTDTTYSDFTGTDGTTAGTNGLVPAPATTDADKFLKSDGTWSDAGGGTLYTALGQNTDGAMTQKSITDALYRVGRDPVTAPSEWSINIGTMTNNGTKNICIGDNLGIDNGYSVAIGGGSSLRYNIGSNAVIVGYNAKATRHGAIALGAYSSVSTTGEMNIGSTNTSYGYNSSNYRLLSGVYDPQSAHDAATKGYVDGLVGDIESALNIINNGGN